MHFSDPDFNPRYHMSREDYTDMMEFRGYAKCSECLVHVPEETLSANPVYNGQRLCPECLKNIREEIELNRKTPKEL